MTTFTPEDLLLYLYQETTPERREEINRALEKDWTLREKLAVLKTSMQRLDKLVTAPRTEIVLNILQHARKQTTSTVQ